MLKPALVAVLKPPGGVTWPKPKVAPPHCKTVLTPKVVWIVADVDPVPVYVTPRKLGKNDPGRLPAAGGVGFAANAGWPDKTSNRGRAVEPKALVFNQPAGAQAP